MIEAYAPDIVVPQKTDTLTPGIIDELNNLLSKNGKSVLLTLYHTPRIQQKVLAVNINTSPTSLSNLLTRIGAITPPLLRIEQVGRCKYYSLTKIAEQYVASELIRKETYNIKTFFSVPANASLYDEARSILYQFQSLAGSEWLLILDDMLLGGTNTDEAKSELFHLYTQFINKMKQMYVQKASLSIHKIYDELSNSILVSRLENYLKNSLKDSHALIPLFDLEKQNPQTAIDLINYAFAEMKPKIFEKEDLSLFPGNDLPVSAEQYNAIFHRLLMMVNEFADCHGAKLKVRKSWEETFCTSNITLSFIAEKCNIIFLVESGKFSQ